MRKKDVYWHRTCCLMTKSRCCRSTPSLCPPLYHSTALPIGSVDARGQDPDLVECMSSSHGVVCVAVVVWDPPSGNFMPWEGKVGVWNTGGRGKVGMGLLVGHCCLWTVGWLVVLSPWHCSQVPWRPAKFYVQAWRGRIVYPAHSCARRLSLHYFIFLIFFLV